MKALRQGHGGKTPIVPIAKRKETRAGEEPKATITAGAKQLEAALQKQHIQETPPEEALGLSGGVLLMPDGKRTSRKPCAG